MKINIFSILMFFCVIALLGISGSEAYGQTNLALNKTATQSSVSSWNNMSGTADKAVDGKIGGSGLSETAVTDFNKANDSWFEVDLGNFYKIDRIVLHPRTDCCENMNTSAYIIVTDQAIGGSPMVDETKIKSSSTFYEPHNPIYENKQSRTISVSGKVGRYVRVQMKGWGAVQLGEIEVFGEATPVAGHTPDASKAWNSTTAVVNTSNSTTAAVNTSNSSTGNTAIDPRNLTRNTSVGAVATQSTVFGWSTNSGKPELAIDGKLDGIAESQANDVNDWFELDLKNNYKIDKIVINARNDDYGNGCCRDQFHSVWMIISDQPLPASPMVDEARIYYSSTDARFINEPINGKREIEIGGKVGRYIRLQTKDSRIELNEIEVYGEPTPVAGYTPNSGKAWNAAFVSPFDPNLPNFLGTAQNTNPAYYGTLQGSPKIVVTKNSATSFDVAYQDLYNTGKKIRINTYDKTGTGFTKNAAQSIQFEGLGTFAGFATDAGRNRYVFTSQPWTGYEQLVQAQVTKIPAQGTPDVIWDAKYFEPGKDSLTTGVKSLMNSFNTGTARLVAGNNSLLITTNIYPTHPYQVILDTQDKSKNTNRAFFESMNHHNFGQRAIFDGTNFVIMENRDHDVTVSLTKLSPEKPLPLIEEALTPEELAKLTEKDKWDRHSGPFTKRLYSVYSHTNFANHTFTELGNVEKGFGDGYLVLFASERDWDNKMSGFKPTSEIIKTWSQPQILSPRDIGLVHVKKDFEKETANWVRDGKLSMCPTTVDNSKIVNSTAAAKTVTYKTVNDGWDWTRYNPGSGCENTTERSLTTKGVTWITTFGASSQKADPTKDFTSVNHPKLVRISANKYIVLWEEWKASSAGNGEPKKEYMTTKAALVNLVGSGDQVEIQAGTIKDLGKIRLMPGDDAFEFDGKAAWTVGNLTKGKLMFYTVDGTLNLASYELEL